MRIVPRRLLECPRRCGAVAFLLAVGILLTHYSVKYGLNTPPATSGDELSYDSIGWNLAQGYGFAEGGGDEAFYRPYELSGAFDVDHIAQTIDSAPELVAYRPPLFPMSLAVLNTINGRQFWAVRVMNVLATAGTCGLLVWYLAKTQDRAAAMIAFIMFLAVDTRTRLYGRAILTEATATFLTTAVTLLLIQLSSRMQVRTVLFTGFAAGLLVLDRTVFVLWLPGIVVMVFLLAVRTSMQKPGETLRHHCQSAVVVAGCFLGITVAVVSPWAVRNVSVLNAMMPLGTQGTIVELRKPIVNVMVMNDLPEMRETFVLARGNYAAPLKDRKVEPDVPAALPALPTDSSVNRLALANWITSPTHPLTARVAVNRYWSLLFGQGIVRSLEDFGARGDWPSHPELLDWLATDFVESNWNVQRALKQIVMSSTYRQSSVVTAEKLTSDPENRLLSRGARFRLQAEFVRDNALAACGLLVPTVGGPGVKPYQPDGLWNEVSLDGNLRFEQDQGDKLYRRSIYTYWRRSAPAPSMTIFDAPTREKCAMRRSRTNTPLQALVTLNDTQFVEASRALAELALKQGGNTISEQIRFAFRRAAATQPSDRVLAIFVDALDEELQRFQQDTESATQLISVGDSARDETLDPANHAAMTVVTSMILNLDQTLTRN